MGMDFSIGFGTDDMKGWTPPFADPEYRKKLEEKEEMRAAAERLEDDKLKNFNRRIRVVHEMMEKRDKDDGVGDVSVKLLKDGMNFEPTEEEAYGNE